LEPDNGCNDVEDDADEDVDGSAGVFAASATNVIVLYTPLI